MFISYFDSFRMTTFPQIQQAVRVHKGNVGMSSIHFDEDAPLPTLGPYDVLVKNYHAGINFEDLYYLTGLLQLSEPQLPFTLGREGSGIIVKTGGSVEHFSVGDHVVYIASGSFAQYTGVDSRERIAKIPHGIRMKTAASCLLQGLTALSLIRESFPVKKDDWVLIHAAAGGTGSLIVQLASKLGAHVIGTTSHPEKIAIAKANGAEHVINYRTEDVAKRVLEITHGHGVDVVYDSVGKTTFDVSVDSLTRKGTLVSCGLTSGALIPISAFQLAHKSLKFVSHDLRNYLYTPEEWHHYMKIFWKTLHFEELEVNISKSYCLGEAKEALADLQSGKTVGKLLIDIEKPLYYSNTPFGLNSEFRE